MGKSRQRLLRQNVPLALTMLQSGSAKSSLAVAFYKFIQNELAHLIRFRNVKHLIHIPVALGFIPELMSVLGFTFPLYVSLHSLRFTSSGENIIR